MPLLIGHLVRLRTNLVRVLHDVWVRLAPAILGFLRLFHEKMFKTVNSFHGMQAS